MVKIENISRVYFIGIGGIGMSAIARYYKENGAVVKGYDKMPTSLTRQMESEGIQINYLDEISHLDKEAELVVYTPAIPKDHSQFNYYVNNKYTILKRSQVLGAITASGYSICIAGTHGKTTISTMVAHILRDSGYGCNAFLGGIPVNYNVNYWSSPRKVFVAEADEYDRSFLQLSPDIAIISAMDPDHLEIYGSEERMQDGFIDFSKKIKPGGLLISKKGIKRENDLKGASHITYSVMPGKADIYATNITIKNGSYEFGVMQADWKIDDLVLHMGGMHNVENAVAAISVAHFLRIDDDLIRKALSSFRGVKRRFEYIIPLSNSNTVFIDDYAHHPEELRALISGARNLFAGKRCTIIFQPHLFSRTRDLADAFASALSLADEVVLLPIYPAREMPVEGVTSNLVLDKITLNEKKVLTKTELLEWIADKKDLELLITAGAGDIDQMVLPIKNLLIS